MIKIAFKPHETRGEEIIKILEGLGGFNRYNTRKTTASFKNTAYCVDERRIIIQKYEEELIESGYKIYTLEEWEKERDEMERCSSDFKYWFDKCCELPEGYQFVDENGNVINAMKIVLEKKKKEYPKTYDKCAEIIAELTDSDCNPKGCMGYMSVQLTALQKLLVCRNVYWHIAGEEMGLGKPWEPDWKNDAQFKYVIICRRNCIIRDTFTAKDVILAFPTEEMRDAFYENFKDLIEQCKELL